MADYFFDVDDSKEEIEFKDRRSNSFYKVRLTKGREQRICGLGPFYRDKQLCGGDEILFEKGLLRWRI